MSVSSSTDAMLLQSVVATTAHDIGGLASALMLRADLLERITSDGSVLAIRSIATELRALGEQLRELRAADGSESLSPTRAGSLERWLTRVRRFGKPLLGYSGKIDGQVHDVHIDSSLAHDLTLITLALLADLRARWPDERVTVRIATELGTDRVRVLIGAAANDAPLSVDPEHGSSWWHWLVARAAASNIPCQIADGQIQLHVRLER